MRAHADRVRRLNAFFDGYRSGDEYDTNAITHAARFLVTDSAAEAVEAITDVAMRQFGLTYGPRLRRRWYFGE